MATKIIYSTGFSGVHPSGNECYLVGRMSNGGYRETTVTFPAVTADGPISGVTLHCQWSYEQSGVGFNTNATHCAVIGGQTYTYAAPKTGSAEIPITSYATSGSWTALFKAYNTEANSVRGYHPSMYLTVTYTDHTPPGTPGWCTISPSPFEGTVNVSWGAASAGVGNAVSQYVLYYHWSSDGVNWEAAHAIQTGGTQTGRAIPAGQLAGNKARGKYLRFSVRAQGSGGLYSDYRYSNIIRYNSAPNPPHIWAPAAGGKTYNKRPLMVAEVGADPDEQTQTLYATITGTGWTALAQGVTKWNKYAYRPAGGLTGSRTFSTYQTDALGASSAANTRTIEILAPNWTDGTLVPGQTPVRAVHIRELRAAIDNVRAYYGLAAASWTDANLAAGTPVRAAHIRELRTAVEQVAAKVNGWVQAIDLPGWTDANLSAGTPVKAAHVQELRDVITMRL